jgi:hypothetical protein
MAETCTGAGDIRTESTASAHAKKKECFQEKKKVNSTMLGSLKDVYVSGTMAHTCNPSYLGGEDQEDLQFVSRPGKMLLRSYLNNKPGVVVSVCDLS